MLNYCVKLNFYVVEGLISSRLPPTQGGWGGGIWGGVRMLGCLVHCFREGKCLHFSNNYLWTPCLGRKGEKIFENVVGKKHEEEFLFPKGSKWVFT